MSNSSNYQNIWAVADRVKDGKRRAELITIPWCNDPIEALKGYDKALLFRVRWRAEATLDAWNNNYERCGKYLPYDWESHKQEDEAV